MSAQAVPTRLGYEEVMRLESRQTFDWTEKDAIQYALGIGMADDPLDETELPFVREYAQQVFPTFPVVVAFPGGPLSQIGLDYRRVLHGEHAITLHRTIPPCGRAVAVGTMLGVWDKGVGKGAVFSQRKTLHLDSGELLASIVTTVFGRSEGGFGGLTQGQPRSLQRPARAPDLVVGIQTLPKQALLYRMSGDLNPLHIDPAVARQAGFERPILHGLCTFAICCRAVVRHCGGGDPLRIRHHALRFSQPVYPGERIEIELWIDHDRVEFEAHVRERDVCVVRSGLALLAAA